MRGQPGSSVRPTRRPWPARLAVVVAGALLGAGLPLAAPATAVAATGNVAAQATATASSWNDTTGQIPSKAIDGAATGYPTDYTKEWATVGGKAGSWLQLTWTAPIRTDRVVLYDRPNTDDRITAANLVFSDGTKLATGSLTNNGAATTVSFPERVTSSIRLEVTTVSSATRNVGLAEIEVWGAAAENRSPVANAGTAFTAPAGTTVTLDGSASSDPDGDVLSYGWKQQGTPTVPLTGADTAKPTFKADAAGSYTFDLTVSDGKLSSTASVTVTVVPNQAPAANAGADQSVYAGSVVTLDGTKSSDPEKSPLSYTWTQVGSTPAAVTLSGASSAQPTFTASVVGTYTFRLVVSDGQASSTPDEVKVAVGDAPPVAANLAGKATATASSQNSTTQQTAAKAIDGFAVGYPTDATKEWATVGGGAGSWLKLVWPAPVTVNKVVLYDRPNNSDRVTGATLEFSDGSTVATGSLVNAGTATTVTFAARTITSLNLNITSVASTNQNVGLAEIEVWGFNAANRAPIANAGSDAVGFTGTTLALDGSSSSDPDGNPLTYKWTQNADGGPAVDIADDTSAKAGFKPTEAGTYAFTLTVSDGKLSSTDTVSVSVATNEPPDANAGPDASGLTGKTITLDGSGSSDPNGNGTLRYSWAQVGTTPASVTLTGPTTAKPTFTTKTAGNYRFRLTVTDGATEDSDDVEIAITQAPNTAPVANAGADQTMQPGVLITLDGSKSSDADGDTLTYSWALTEGSGVTLTNPKTAKPTFTASANGVFTFTLTVGDGQAEATDTVKITVASAGTLTAANSGTSAVFTANFGSANSGKSVQFQKQTIVTSTTSEVTAASWVSIGSATANGSGVAKLTVANPLEVEHSYRAVINPTSATPLLSDVVKYAAPHAAMSPATGLATVYIDTNEGASIANTTDYWEGRMTITAATKAAGTTSTACATSTNLLMKVSGRGNYTWTLDKKPYKIGLDKKVNLCGMGTAKKWALIANHYDRSLLRNTAAMKMGQGLSNLAFTPDSVPVDVYVNGTYQGAYTLMERVNVGEGRVANGENQLKDNQGGANDSAPAVTGTYLLEWDFRAGGDHNVTVGDSGIIAINEPENEDDGSGITAAQISYITKYLNDADKAVFASNFADPANGWRKYIDEKSLIDWYIVQELTKNLDSNLYTSCIMYKTRDTASTPGKLYFGPIWDFDTSMGSALYPANQGTTSGWYLRNENANIEAKMTSETWINRIFTDTTFAANVKARWKQVYSSLQGSDAFIATQSGLISTSATANFGKWNVSERFEDEQVIKGSWSAEVTYLRDWLKARLTWMNGQLGS